LAKHWKDGRVRFRLNSTGTDTGRYSSGGKWKYLDENNNKVTLPGINIQNIPSHNPEIRMLFKAKVEEVQKEFDDLLVVPEITEVETVNGYQYCRDLHTGDKLLINDGEVVDIKDITYNANKKEYSIKI
jgi:GTPase SAR1 family protein